VSTVTLLALVITLRGSPNRCAPTSARAVHRVTPPLARSVCRRLALRRPGQRCGPYTSGRFPEPRAPGPTICAHRRGGRGIVVGPEPGSIVRPPARIDASSDRVLSTTPSSQTRLSEYEFLLGTCQAQNSEVSVFTPRRPKESFLMHHGGNGPPGDRSSRRFSMQVFSQAPCPPRSRGRETPAGSSRPGRRSGAGHLSKPSVTVTAHARTWGGRRLHSQEGRRGVVVSGQGVWRKAKGGRRPPTSSGRLVVPFITAPCRSRARPLESVKCGAS
jgi:hypothetical protein